MQNVNSRGIHALNKCFEQYYIYNFQYVLGSDLLGEPQLELKVVFDYQPNQAVIWLKNSMVVVWAKIMRGEYAWQGRNAGSMNNPRVPMDVTSWAIHLHISPQVRWSKSQHHTITSCILKLILTPPLTHSHAHTKYKMQTQGPHFFFSFLFFLWVEKVSHFEREVLVNHTSGMYCASATPSSF